MIVCVRCGQSRSSDEFTSEKRKRNGKQSYCRSCMSTYRKQYYKENGQKPPDRDGRRRWARAPKRRAKLLVKHAQMRASKRKIEFNLDSNDIETLQRVIDIGVCELSGARMDLESAYAPNGPSIDRIVPRLGYTKGNVRIVCGCLNTAFGKWGPDAVAPIFEAWLNKRKVTGK